MVTQVIEQLRLRSPADSETTELAQQGAAPSSSAEGTLGRNGAIRAGAGSWVCLWGWGQGRARRVGPELPQRHTLPEMGRKTSLPVPSLLRTFTGASQWSNLQGRGVERYRVSKFGEN